MKLQKMESKPIKKARGRVGGSQVKGKALEFRNLTDKNVIELLTLYNQKELAEIYETHTSFISTEITKRNLFQPKPKYVGAWSNSEERKSWKEFAE